MTIQHFINIINTGLLLTLVEIFLFIFFSETVLILNSFIEMDKSLKFTKPIYQPNIVGHPVCSTTNDGRAVYRFFQFRPQFHIDDQLEPRLRLGLCSGPNEVRFHRKTNYTVHFSKHDHLFSYWNATKSATHCNKYVQTFVRRRHQKIVFIFFAVVWNRVKWYP